MRRRAAILASTLAMSIAAGAAQADRYGLGEDLLLRPGQPLEDLAMAATVSFWASGTLVGVWASVKFLRRVDAPEPGGLAAPVVGFLVALALLAAALLAPSALIDGLHEGPSPGFRPPVLGTE